MADIVALFNQNCEGLGVMAGDFNCILNNEPDKSSQSQISNPRASKMLHHSSKDTGLVNVWSKLNPQTRDYTFYSNFHK